MFIKFYANLLFYSYTYRISKDNTNNQKGNSTYKN